MSRPYRILMIEDLPSDAILIKREVKKFFGACDFFVTDSKEEFTEGLNAFKPDVILSDYCVPGFDWYTAFKITLAQTPGIPFIIVSGSTNPKIAAECMSSGAMDFISKEDIKSLCPAILKALEHKDIQ